MPSETLHPDFELLSSPVRLQREGILLTEASGSKLGRVVFSLEEIPLHISFSTPSQTVLQRVSASIIHMTRPNSSLKHKIELPKAINSFNKDRYLWAQIQADISNLANEKHISTVGITLRDQLTGNSETFYSLQTIPVQTKYFTENDNVLVRKSQHELLLSDHLFTVGNPPVPTKTDSGTLGDFTPGNVTEAIPGELLAQVAKLMMESFDFPKLIKYSLSGTYYHTGVLRIDREYQGGVEGNSVIRWERCGKKSQIFSSIPGATSLQYSPSVADIGYRIRFVYLPVRADGVTGPIVFSDSVKIKCDPKLTAEVRSNLILNSLVFKVLLRNGNEFQKRSILLNKEKLKIRKCRTTISKVVYKGVKVIPHLDNNCLFTLDLAGCGKSVFVTPSPFLRDNLVLSILAFSRNTAQIVHM